MSKEQKRVASLCPEAMTDSVVSKLDGQKVEIVSAKFIDRPTKDETKSFAVLEIGYGVLDEDGDVTGEPVMQGYSVGQTSPAPEWEVSGDGNSVYEILECGHRVRERQDIFGPTNAYARRCRFCPPNPKK